jgi:uncharacterized protein
MKFRPENYKQFMKAILDQEEDMVEIYLNKGIDVNFQDGIGNTPLILAAKTNNVKLIELLIKFGAKLELSNLMDETPLLEAIDLSCVHSAKYLISVGANINTKDFRGKSLLYRLLNNPNLECFKLLLENNIHINPEDELKISNNKHVNEVYLAFKERKILENEIKNYTKSDKKQKL